jgi:hypothetical protein
VTLVLPSPGKDKVGPIRMIRPGVIELAVVRIDTSDE